LVSLHKAAITAVVPFEHDQALVRAASVVPKSGTKTYGLARFWNGSQSRTAHGVELSALAWRASTGHCAYGRSVEQTPPTSEAITAEATRIDGELEPWTRVVSAHESGVLHAVVPDGDDSPQPCSGGVRSFGRHQLGK
jgi:hypothetical protein